MRCLRFAVSLSRPSTAMLKQISASAEGDVYGALSAKGDELDVSAAVACMINGDLGNEISKVIAGRKTACFFEMRPVLRKTNAVNGSFRFALIDGMPTAKVNKTAFAKKLRQTDDSDTATAAAFLNLQEDAWLVAPRQQIGVAAETYTNINTFSANASKDQIADFWRLVGQTIIANDETRTLTDGPLWISTSGTGVAWLHVRIEHTPKYYKYEDFKSCEILPTQESTEHATQHVLEHTDSLAKTRLPTQQPTEHATLGANISTQMTANARSSAAGQEPAEQTAWPVAPDQAPAARPASPKTFTENATGTLMAAQMPVKRAASRSPEPAAKRLPPIAEEPFGQQNLTNGGEPSVMRHAVPAFDTNDAMMVHVYVKHAEAMYTYFINNSSGLLELVVGGLMIMNQVISTVTSRPRTLSDLEKDLRKFDRVSVYLDQSTIRSMNSMLKCNMESDKIGEPLSSVLPMLKASAGVKMLDMSVPHTVAISNKIVFAFCITV
jgi:hypothetical protein